MMLGITHRGKGGNVMADNQNTTKGFEVLGTPEGFQKYILGTKKNGNPRAVYDVVRDYIPPRKKSKRKKKSKKSDNGSLYDLYRGKKSKKKKKNKIKYWHI